MEQPLLTYLQQIKELEGIKYTQEQLTLHLANQASRLGKARNVEIHQSVKFDQMAERGMKIGLIVGGVIPVLFFVPQLFHYPKFSDTIWLFVKMIFWSCVSGILFMIIGNFIGKALDSKHAKAVDLENTVEDIANVEKDKKRVQQELRIQAGIKSQLRLIKTQRDSISQALEQLYSLNIVHPKYRSLVPIAMFCEYFETGRSSELAGHEGAYNIYEQEARLDKIATKLDVIICQLDSVRESQYDLYEILLETNQILSRVEAKNNQMIQSLGTIEENTELTVYNTYANGVKTQALGDMMVVRELLS